MFVGFSDHFKEILPQKGGSPIPGNVIPVAFIEFIFFIRFGVLFRRVGTLGVLPTP